jgi:hypothetical protein
MRISITRYSISFGADALTRVAWFPSVGGGIHHLHFAPPSKAPVSNFRNRMQGGRAELQGRIREMQPPSAKIYSLVAASRRCDIRGSPSLFTTIYTPPLVAIPARRVPAQALVVSARKAVGHSGLVRKSGTTWAFHDGDIAAGRK